MRPHDVASSRQTQIPLGAYRMAHRMPRSDDLQRSSWGSRVALAIEDRAKLKPERELLADQITAIEAFETAKREQLLTENS